MSEPLTLALTGTSDITFRRSFAASRPLLWQAFTDPKLIPQWLWAREAPMVLCEVDFREGGSYRWIWRLKNGHDMGISGRYLELKAPARMVHTEVFDEDWTGGETVVTTEFAEVAPQYTRMTMVVHYASAEARAGAMRTDMAGGMEESYSHLDATLPRFLAESRASDFRIMAEGACKLTVTRSFRAPLAAVRAAHLDAQLVPKWMGTPDFPMTACEIDPRPGGAFRYVWATPEGPLTLTGTFAEVTDSRIAHRESFDPDWTGGATDVVTEFREQDGRTQVRMTMTYSSQQARDKVGATGMAEGMAAGYDVLDGLL
jgi:uncharacterized protein YndB with AHSA1/START domain